MQLHETLKTYVVIVLCTIFTMLMTLFILENFHENKLYKNNKHTNKQTNIKKHKIQKFNVEQFNKWAKEVVE